jgi:twitching motility protein PilT
MFHEVAGRVRVTFYRRNGHPELSVRLCGDHIASREELGLPKVVDDLARRPNGLVLVTGPTGAGKTTTLNYMVNLINHERRCKIVTIEDPIEFVHANDRAIVVQQEVLTDVKSFNRALIHVLRQDPDVIVVGEIRDYEAISTALAAAETGHLVLATMHSTSVTQALERIVGCSKAALSGKQSCNCQITCKESSPSRSCPPPTAPAVFWPMRFSSPVPRVGTIFVRINSTKSRPPSKWGAERV